MGPRMHELMGVDPSVDPFCIRFRWDGCVLIDRAAHVMLCERHIQSYSLTHQFDLKTLRVLG